MHVRQGCIRGFLAGALGIVQTERSILQRMGKNMAAYRITLHSGQAIVVEDARELQRLSADLCSDGFVVVRRRATAYSDQTTDYSLLERAVVSIEPADQA